MPSADLLQLAEASDRGSRLDQTTSRKANRNLRTVDRGRRVTPILGQGRRFTNLLDPPHHLV
jgi:hypothetical protein